MSLVVAGTIRAGGDEFGHVGGFEELAWGRRAEGVEELVTLPVLRAVEVLGGDAVDVGGVLDERAARIAQVPEPVRPDRMTADAPHVAVGVDVDHVLAAAHHVVDVVDLERDVVREGDRRRLDGEVVVDLAAAGEGDDALHLIADLEADHVGEELPASWAGRACRTRRG